MCIPIQPEIKCPWVAVRKWCWRDSRGRITPCYCCAAAAAIRTSPYPSPSTHTAECCHEDHPRTLPSSHTFLLSTPKCSPSTPCKNCPWRNIGSQLLIIHVFIRPWSMPSLKFGEFIFQTSLLPHGAFPRVQQLDNGQASLITSWTSHQCCTLSRSNL